MDRVACVDVHHLPLQILLHTHPDWAAQPVVVVDQDKPLGIIQWANRAARALRILPGMRYAAGLALSRELRGAVVSEATLRETVSALTQRLWGYSPRIEPSPDEPGVFWLDATGLRRIYPSLEGWAECIRGDLRDAGYHSVTAVGFTRFGCYACAKSADKNRVFDTPKAERRYVRGVPLERLGIAPTLRDTLFKLGIQTLGEFVDLPEAGIRERFGEDAWQLHSAARGDGWTPLVPTVLHEPVIETVLLDYPEDNVERLLFLLAQPLQAVLRTLAKRHERLRILRYTLTLDNGDTLHGEVTPAQPARDTTHLLPLLRLRLEATPLTAGVVECSMAADGIEEHRQQLDLLEGASQQNVEAAERAFARVRAEFGNTAVVCAVEDEGHLPEAQYHWETVRSVARPQPAPTDTAPLVRRIFHPPLELPPCNRHRPDGWLIAGVSEGPVEEVIGPHIVSGGWWTGDIARTYYYVRTRSERWLWIYYDKNRRRWFLHGEVQ